MNVLVLGGTRFFGVHLVHDLLRAGHEVTIATRGLAKDPFAGRVNRLTVNRTDVKSLQSALSDHHFTITYDNLAYCSNEVKYLLDNLHTDRYVMTSTCSVYHLHPDLQETYFDPMTHKLVWCNRDAYPYDEVKRQAECALYQAYPQVDSSAMRIPFVIGPDDYTGRLRFYVEHIVQNKPMCVDNLDAELSFISSEEAGRFMAWLGTQTIQGPVNGSSMDTISLRRITDYVGQQLGRSVQLDPQGDAAPYNGCPSFSLHTGKAEAAGYTFQALDSWIFPLLDSLIESRLI